MLEKRLMKPMSLGYEEDDEEEETEECSFGLYGHSHPVHYHNLQIHQILIEVSSFS